MAVDLPETACLTEANLSQVSNARDPARRREVIAHTYTADVRWTDDNGTTVGHDALSTKAQQLQDGPLTGSARPQSLPMIEPQGLRRHPSAASARFIAQNWPTPWWQRLLV